MTKLLNKSAVITGGASGIGYAAASKMKSLAANVIITGRNQAQLDKACKELDVTAIQSDQGNLSDIDQLVASVKEVQGKVDILFINAGVAGFAPVAETDETLFDNIMNVNFKGAFFTLQKFLPILNDGASVINLSSINAYTGMPNTAVYAASKAALNSLTRTASSELAPRKIRVNSINPGPVNTPIFGKLGMPEEFLNEFAAAMQSRIPLKRFGESEDIANLVAFLASDDSIVVANDF